LAFVTFAGCLAVSGTDAATLAVMSGSGAFGVF
jgi:hypothetical protein